MKEAYLKYLNEEIQKTDDQLFAFTKTRAWDSGVRDVSREFYLKGLERAKRLVRKGIKEGN